MKLIILNGPPGAGKSSVAEEIHKVLSPLSFFLKFDAQRRFLKDRHENRLKTRSFNYKICKAIIEATLKDGKDLLFEGVIPEPEIIDEFIEIGQKYEVEVFEFILTADKDTILERNTDRGLPADGLLDSKEVSLEAAEKYWNLMNDLKGQRPKAHVVDVKENDLEQVVDIVKGFINL